MAAAACKSSQRTIAKWGQFPVDDFLSHLTNEERERYNQKVAALDIYDPYKAPAQVFNCLKNTESLPDLDFGDIWIYLVNNPSPYTAEEMKSYKATDSHKYAVSGWVNWPIIWTLEKENRPKFHVIKARVSALYFHYYWSIWHAMIFMPSYTIAECCCNYISGQYPTLWCV